MNKSNKTNSSTWIYQVNQFKAWQLITPTCVFSLFLGGMVAPTTETPTTNGRKIHRSPRPGSCLDYTSLDQENVPGATGRIDLYNKSCYNN